MTRQLRGEDDEAIQGANWNLSRPIPGYRILNTWEIYHGMWLVLTLAENDHYCLFRSTDKSRFVLVHDHASTIFNLFFVDHGIALMSAEDGWWVTDDTGLNWVQFSADGPDSKSAVLVQAASTTYIIAYGEDHKIYKFEYPSGSWIEVLDTTSLWVYKWYPAIAGGPVGILAGVGQKILRTTDMGDTWKTLHEVTGIVKNIVVSNQSNLPIFLIEVESESGISTIYRSYDLGDSLVQDIHRVGLTSDVQSVYPTGESQTQTQFVIVGQRESGGATTLRIIEEP
jgi:hypothetical protein